MLCAQYFPRTSNSNTRLASGEIFFTSAGRAMIGSIGFAFVQNFRATACRA